MTARELLELAAKAAGIVVNQARTAEINSASSSAMGLWTSTATNWNPLDSDGDALRLAVKLNMTIEIERRTIQVEYYVDGIVFSISEDGEKRACDPYVATRRAIVRAAAEIGKGMP